MLKNDNNWSSLSIYKIQYDAKIHQEANFTKNCLKFYDKKSMHKYILHCTQTNINILIVTLDIFTVKQFSRVKRDKKVINHRTLLTQISYSTKYMVSQAHCIFVSSHLSTCDIFPPLI